MGWGNIWLGMTLVILLFWFSLAGLAEEKRDWTALLNGQVEVQEVDNDEGIPGVRAFFTVSASKKKIWAVLLDYKHFPKFFKGILEMRVLSSEQDSALIEFKIDAVVKNFTYVLHRQYDEMADRITWRRHSGDLKRIEGSWQIRDTPQADKKLLIYESFVKVGGIIPTGLVRWGAMGKAKEMGHRLRKWIEEQPNQ